MEEIYVGIDLHRKFSFAAVMNKSGKIKENQRLEHDNLQKFISFFRKYDKAKITMEATCGWMWVADLLEDMGHEVTLAHSSGVKAISSSHKKTDKIDAKTLGNLLRTNYLPEAYLAPKEVRSNREILRLRTSLVKTRTMAKNRVQSQLIKINKRPLVTDIFGRKGREALENYELPEVHRKVVDEWLLLIDFVDMRIAEIEKEIKSRLEKDPRADILQSMPGIGMLTAYTIISEVGDIERFANADKFSSYCGLVPSTHQSADKVYHGRLVMGRTTLKWNIVEATHIAKMRDSYFATVFQKYLKKNNRTRATIICAHKMAKIIYRMLKEMRPYRPKSKNGEMKVGSSAPVTN